MSVLIKRIDSSSGGGSSKGYPPGNVTNVTIKGGYKKVVIKWTDPDDVVIGDKTLSTWQSTTLVRKKGSIPTSIKDGDIVLETTEKNKYKNTEYTDNNLEIGTYYYRFFVCNTDKIYNNDSGMIYSAAAVEFDPILSNNSWEQITIASESGMASSLWKVGDEIDITLSGAFNETITLQIWDFNHFDKSDGSGKAGIVFGMKNLMESSQYMYKDLSNSNGNGWDTMKLRTETMGKMLSSFPTDLQSCIKEVYTYANEGQHADEDSNGRLSKDKLFIPGSVEVGIMNQAYTEKAQKQFPIFTDDNSRIKRMSNGTGNPDSWWTRSAQSNSSDEFIYVYENGKSSFNYHGGVDPSYTLGICFCFNV